MNRVMAFSVAFSLLLCSCASHPVITDSPEALQARINTCEAQYKDLSKAIKAYQEAVAELQVNCR